MAAKPKTPPKAPAKAAAADPKPAIPPTGGGTDAPPAEPHPDNAVADLQAQQAAGASLAAAAGISNEVNPQQAEVNNKAKPKLQAWPADGAEVALDRLDKIETLAIRWGGEVGQEIRQLCCEAMVALGKK